MTGPIWSLEEVGGEPLVAVALHHGHEVRPTILPHLALSDEERLREEDPWTGRWTALAPVRVVVRRSRFEVDMNRPRTGCVYLHPEDAWGLRVWREPGPPEAAIETSREEYDAFYAQLRTVLDEQVRRHGKVVVYDLHSYNHRRGGPGAPRDDPSANPDVNLGTGTVDRGRWAGVVRAFLDSMSAQRIGGERVDVRENVRFQGGHFAAWVHATYPGRACALAVDVKKFFMDEWTGEVDEDLFDGVGGALAATTGPVLEALEAA